jgi:endoglucanase
MILNIKYSFTLLQTGAKTINITIFLCALFILSACGGSSTTEPELADTTKTPDVITPPAVITPELPVGTALLIEAEDYVRFLDTTVGNEGNAFRNDNVDIEALTDDSGFIVGWTEAGEWLEYDITLTAGSYILTTSVASELGGASYSLSLDGVELGTDNIGATGGWQVFEDHDVALFTAIEGAYTLRIEIVSGPFNIDNIHFKLDDGSFVPPAVVPEEVPLELPDVEIVIDPAPISPETAVSDMGIGINLGNTLDAPSEGAWAPAAQEQFIIDFKDAGFKHVRIPVTWDNRTATSAPYQVDTVEMDRVETVVDWALAQDLYVVLNMHHEGWIENNFSQHNRNRFDSIWLQIVERFKHKSPKLIFEVLNEPNGLTAKNVDEINVRVLDIIRRVNPTRLVVYSGEGYTPLDSLLAAAIPDEDDEYLIGNFHNYDPWPFAGMCTRSWGTDADIAALGAIYQRAADWSTENDIPVTVNEFGVAHYDFTAPDNVCDEDDRLAYIEAHVTFATKHGIAATFWDDAGSFSTYDRATNTWGDEKDILVAPNLP